MTYEDAKTYDKSLTISEYEAIKQYNNELAAERKADAEESDENVDKHGLTNAILNVFNGNLKK